MLHLGVILLIIREIYYLKTEKKTGALEMNNKTKSFK